MIFEDNLQSWADSNIKSDLCFLNKGPVRGIKVDSSHGNADEMNPGLDKITYLGSLIGDCNVLFLVMGDGFNLI